MAAPKKTTELLKGTLRGLRLLTSVAKDTEHQHQTRSVPRGAPDVRNSLKYYLGLSCGVSVRCYFGLELKHGRKKTRGASLVMCTPYAPLTDWLDGG